VIHPLWLLKGALVRLACPLFFRSIGRGTRFTGRVRLPLPLRGVVIGERCMIGHDVYFQTGRTSEIAVGDDSSLNTGCHLVASERISIGRNVAIGEYVSIRDQEHRFAPDSGVRGKGFKVSPVRIEDNVWIGRGVYIGPGTHIRAGSIVGANSVVSGDFPPNVLIAGAPATIRRSILPTGERLPIPATSRPFDPAIAE
jgi:acetyltransferase-like isoleucine patch superfamily enzyme